MRKIKLAVAAMLAAPALALGGCAHQAKSTAVTAVEAPSARATMGFFKFIVKDPDTMQAFYEDVFGFEVVNHYTFPGIDERVMRLPGQTLSLVLFHHTDGRDVTIGNAYGPVGFVTQDVDGLYADALAAGATRKTPPYDLGQTGTRLAFVLDPEGHELELIRLTGQ